MNKDEELLFAEEMTTEHDHNGEHWKILIADDEEEVHAVTRMVLEHFTFEGKGVELLSVYSGAETKKALIEHPDTAVLLLDVVMEEDTTGLEVVRYIREELHNNFVRIILRTGQPGQAPERQVTMEYDINDYKEKTELTAQKLFTTIIGLLRAYRDLRMIEKSRKGLEQISEISAQLFELQSLKRFTHGLLTHLSGLLHVDDASESSQHSGVAISRQGQEYYIISGIGRFEGSEGCLAHEVISDKLYAQLIQCFQHRRPLSFPDAYAGYFSTKSGSEHLIYIESQAEINDVEKELIRVLEVNASVAFENIDLNQAIIKTQREVIFTLGEVVETRLQQPEKHIKTVAAYSHLLALKAGLSPEEASMLRLASPLHDVGTLGIPDSILHHQDALHDEELATFKKHPLIGYKILQGTKQPILQMAAQLTLQHHEHWDGTGYPQGLQGEEIHIFARIFMIANALEHLLLALPSSTSEQLPAIKIFFQNERGKRFDPALVDILLEHLGEFL